MPTSTILKKLWTGDKFKLRSPIPEETRERLKWLKINPEQVFTHYQTHEGRAFYPEWIGPRPGFILVQGYYLAYKYESGNEEVDALELKVFGLPEDIMVQEEL